jgi:hypothetical protein
LVEQPIRNGCILPPFQALSRLIEYGRESSIQSDTDSWNKIVLEQRMHGCGAASLLHKNSRERYDRLKVQFRRLMRNFNHDDLEDFILTASSMPEWMKDDPSMVQEQRDGIGRFTLPESLDWQICRQIANRQKHGPKTGGARLGVKSVSAKPSGPGVFLQSGRTARIIGAGEDISIDYDGTQQSALAFVIRTMKHYHYMFEMAPIPPAQRQIPTLENLIGV